LWREQSREVDYEALARDLRSPDPIRSVFAATYNQMTTLEPHPFANAFPMMTDRKYAELVADIKANGLKTKVGINV
jgi:hypothetical protein